MENHIENNNLMPQEQKGCAPNTLGCIDQLLIDSMVLCDPKENQKSLSVAWIDYAKAYHSVPHSWILHCLETYKFDPNLVNYFKNAMKKWKTQLHLNHTSGTITSRTIDINSGIFEGDSPSGLAFCISLIPLTWLINKTGLGYYIGKGHSIEQLISHLLFIWMI